MWLTIKGLDSCDHQIDDFSSKRHPALSFCLSMISGQTFRVCPEGKPVPTPHQVRGRLFPDHALNHAPGAVGAFGLRGQPRRASYDNFDFPVFEPIDTANYAEFPLLDRRVENRRRRLELRNIVDHILPNGGVEEIAGTL